MKTSGGRRAASRALAVTATAATVVLLAAPVAGAAEDDTYVPEPTIELTTLTPSATGTSVPSTPSPSPARTTTPRRSRGSTRAARTSSSPASPCRAASCGPAPSSGRTAAAPTGPAGASWTASGSRATSSTGCAPASRCSSRSTRDGRQRGLPAVVPELCDEPARAGEPDDDHDGLPGLAHRRDRLVVLVARDHGRDRGPVRRRRRGARRRGRRGRAAGAPHAQELTRRPARWTHDDGLAPSRVRGRRGVRGQVAVRRTPSPRGEARLETSNAQRSTTSTAPPGASGTYHWSCSTVRTSAPRRRRTRASSARASRACRRPRRPTRRGRRPRGPRARPCPGTSRRRAGAPPRVDAVERGAGQHLEARARGVLGAPARSDLRDAVGRLEHRPVVGAGELEGRRAPCPRRRGRRASRGPRPGRGPTRRPRSPRRRRSRSCSPRGARRRARPSGRRAGRRPGTPGGDGRCGVGSFGDARAR